MKHKLSVLSKDNVLLALFALLIIVVLANAIVLTNKPTSQETPKTVIVYAQIGIVEISNSTCSNCYDMSIILANIRTQNVNMSQRNLDFLTQEAQSLVSKYNVTRLPALIVTGEINKTTVLSNFWSQLGVNRNGAVIIEAKPPYYSVKNKTVVGLVTLTRVVDSSCNLCLSLDDIVSTFKQYGVVITEDKTVEYNSPEGRKLISMYNVHEIPTIIVSDNILVYPAIAQIWPLLNVTEKNNSYDIHVFKLPYRDLSLNRTIGLVDVIYLSDSSCTSCYDVSMHREILQGGFDVALVNETFLDVNSTQGKLLASKYNITYVPTFVMSPDAKFYVSLMETWPTVGTSETNGWYVFRNMTQLGNVTYKNLATGKLVTTDVAV